MSSIETIHAVPQLALNPRDYQERFLRAMAGGKRNACLVWHRRARKTSTVFAYLAWLAQSASGNYYYYFPDKQFARRILWEGKTAAGQPLLDMIPQDVISNKNETEMKLTIDAEYNGHSIRSILQLLGTNDSDAVVGPNPRACGFSEYSLQKPNAWFYTMPILTENKGQAIFDFTPRGKNHSYDLYKLAKGNPAEWYCELLTVNDTKDLDGNPVISKEMIDADRRRGMSEALIQQEYYCSFEGENEESTYGDQMSLCRADGRIKNVPWESRLPVLTFWDLGMDDYTSVWFVQIAGQEIRIIDYYQESGGGLEKAVKKVTARPYVYSRHYGPWDLAVREWCGGGKKRIDIARSLGIHFRIAPQLHVREGIAATRALFSRMFFDADKCEAGISALCSYDENGGNDVDWARHAADALRTMGVCLPKSENLEVRQIRTITEYNPLTYRPGQADGSSGREGKKITVLNEWSPFGGDR